MSKTQPQLEGLKVAWESCKGLEDQKNSLITQLFAHIKELATTLSETKSELQDKKDVIKLVRHDIETQMKEIRDLNREKARHAFALVMIDGDNMPFNDELVQQGLEGGKITASLLKEAVESELKTAFPNLAPHLKVIFRVYANFQGLAATYKKLEVASESTFMSFVRGFNMGHPLSDFVDAGHEKECADEKIKAMLSAQLDDVHCQHIFFGGPADGGYARQLAPLAQSDTIRARITLIQGPPFARTLASIKDRFHVPTTSFDHIFRSQKLPDFKRRVSFRITPPATPSVNYASTVAKPPPITPPASVTALQPRTNTVLPKGILRNRQGQRIDPPSKFTPTELFALQQRKLCNSFHLLGTCYYLNRFNKCKHKHGDQLSTGQMEMLRVIARQSPCWQGLECEDSACILGHRCTRNDCQPSSCLFPPVMHNIDVNVAG